MVVLCLLVLVASETAVTRIDAIIITTSYLWKIVLTFAGL